MATKHTHTHTQELNGRRVTVLKHGDAVHCFDSLCHHQGGDLGGLGDIEDFKGTCVIRCPVHRRRVSLATGDVVDTDLFGNVCAAPGGPKQRIHACYVDVDGAVRVVLNSTDLPRESDKYNLVATGGGGGAGASCSATAAAASAGAVTAAAAAARPPPSAAAAPVVVGGLGGSGRGLGGFGAVPASRGRGGVTPALSSSSTAPVPSPVVVPGASLAGGNSCGLTPYAGSDAATKYEAQRLEEAARVAAAAGAAATSAAAAAAGGAASTAGPLSLRAARGGSSSSSSSLSGDSSSSDASPSTSPPIPGYYNPNRHSSS